MACKRKRSLPFRDQAQRAAIVFLRELWAGGAIRAAIERCLYGELNLPVRPRLSAS
jgi:hypothetical protein